MRRKDGPIGLAWSVLGLPITESNSVTDSCRTTIMHELPARVKDEVEWIWIFG